MGLLDTLKEKSKKVLSTNAIDSASEQVTLGKVTSEIAQDVIQELSGGQVEFKRKLIDNVLLFTSSAGGTGVTTVVSNIAYIAKQKGLRVLVIDLHITNPMQDSIWGVASGAPKPDLIGYLLGKNDLKSAIITTGNFSILYSHNRGIMETINCEDDSVVSSYEALILNLRAMYDIVLIDCPNNFEHSLINSAFYNCDHIYNVWDEGLASIINTEKLRRNLAFTGVDSYTKMSVIMNKRTDCTYGDYPFKKLNIELDGLLPFDPSVIECSLRSQVFVDKAVSHSDNANTIYTQLYLLADKIFERGGMALK